MNCQFLENFSAGSTPAGGMTNLLVCRSMVTVKRTG
jgi:hypothetical protein